MPDLFARGTVRRVDPAAVQFEQFLGGGQIRLLADLPLGLLVLAPFRPLQLLLAGRREFVGDGIGGGHAVLMAGPNRDQGLARKYPIAKHLALGRPREEFDPDLVPR